MSLTVIGIVGFVILLLLFFLGFPVGFAMALVGLVSFCYVVSAQSGLSLLAIDVFSSFSSYSLTVIPMFIFMGSIAFYSGMSGRLYDSTYKFLGRARGGLAMATSVACAGFAAICGSTTASAAAMGKVTLPEMKRYNYDPALATGCVASGGTLGILIPPSTVFIIYGIMTEQSIGKLFISGIIPGIILTILFVITIYILCRRNPNLAPPGARATWKEKIMSLFGVVEMLILFALVMGGLFVGFFTPTEAGAVGAAGALVITLARRTLTWQGFVDSLIDTTRISCMVFIIVTGAIIFGHFLAVTRIPLEAADWLGALPLPRLAIFGLIIVMYFIGGCLMDSLALITLTIPILYPIILALGFDPIWFGVVIVLCCEMGVITPPVGINVFVIRGVAPEVPLETIFRGIFPFLGAIIVNIGIVIAFPQVALFLPSLMR